MSPAAERPRRTARRSSRCAPPDVIERGDVCSCCGRRRTWRSGKPTATCRAPSGEVRESQVAGEHQHGDRRIHRMRRERRVRPRRPGPQDARVVGLDAGKRRGQPVRDRERRERRGVVATVSRRIAAAVLPVGVRGRERSDRTPVGCRCSSSRGRGPRRTRGGRRRRRSTGSRPPGGAAAARHGPGRDRRGSPGPAPGRRRSCWQPPSTKVINVPTSTVTCRQDTVGVRRPCRRSDAAALRAREPSHAAASVRRGGAAQSGVRACRPARTRGRSARFVSRYQGSGPTDRIGTVQDERAEHRSGWRTANTWPKNVP